MSLPVVFSAGWFSPMQEPWGPGYLVSLALAIASYCLLSPSGRAAIAVALLLHALGRPGFP